MKTTQSNTLRNFLPKRILLSILFAACFGLSAYSQNFFTATINNSSGCTWSRVEAFDASNNSLGVINTLMAPSAGPWVMNCLPQANVLDHFDITTPCGVFTILLNNTVTLCGGPGGCSSFTVTSTTASNAVCTIYTNQLNVQIF